MASKKSPDCWMKVNIDIRNNVHMHLSLSEKPSDAACERHLVDIAHFPMLPFQHALSIRLSLLPAVSVTIAPLSDSLVPRFSSGSDLGFPMSQAIFLSYIYKEPPVRIRDGSGIPRSREQPWTFWHHPPGRGTVVCALFPL